MRIKFHADRTLCQLASCPESHFMSDPCLMTSPDGLCCIRPYHFHGSHQDPSGAIWDDGRWQS